MLRRTVGLGVLSGAVATAYSVYDNDFNVDSVGIVRFTRAGLTVSFPQYRFIVRTANRASYLIGCRFLGAARYVPLQDHSVRAVGRQVVRKLSSNKIKSVFSRRVMFSHSLQCEIID